MSASSRKQKEIADRHDLLLDIAHEIFTAEGYQQLNMNKIAELAEYSKGTVYQHFHCKEEVLVQLCNRCMHTLSGLFDRASRFEGYHRERMVAIFTAHALWAQLEPKNQDLIQTLCADGVKSKICPQSLAEHTALEASLLNQVATIVNDAITDGDLPELEQLSQQELVFGLWSLAYGGRVLLSLNLPLAELGVHRPQHAIFTTVSAVLDGLGWKPLSSEFDYPATMQRVQNEVFAEELASCSANDETEKQIS